MIPTPGTEWPTWLRGSIRTTSGTTWVFDGAGRYQRLPAHEGAPLMIPDTIDDALVGLIWHPFDRAVWVERWPGTPQLNIHPAHRSASATGIFTGAAIAITTGGRTVWEQPGATTERSQPCT